MPTLHALHVGINAYPNQNHTLRGCLNDVALFQQYLKSYCEAMGYQYRPLVLTDAAATRQGIINAFEHFQVAEKEDCCLFQFSGHGARWAAPEAFFHLEKDRMLESLVCYDSREPGGYDLMDKELSYLVWLAGQKTERPFVTVIDSCHSGDLRSGPEVAHDVKLEVVGVRGLRDSQATSAAAPLIVSEDMRLPVCPLPTGQFEGIAHYLKSAGERLSPPLGRRIHLGAARENEYAKEVLVGAQPRNISVGIFTYCLIDTLNYTGPRINCVDLMHRVNLRIRQNVKEQSAQLRSTFPDDRKLGFLFSQANAVQASYLVSWDKDAIGWYVNAGGIHGLHAGDTQSPTILELVENQYQVRVEIVEPTRSRVSAPGDCDTRRSYPAVFRQRAVPQLRLAFAPDSESEGAEPLRRMLETRRLDPYVLCDAIEKANYLIHARERSYYLSGLHDDRPLFHREQEYSEASQKAFLKALDKVAAWQQTLDLQNPDTEIQNPEIGVELYRLTKAWKDTEMDDNVPVEQVDWQTGPVSFQYFRDSNGRRDLLPAFQLKLRNNGVRKLWVSLLYLDAQFGIMNKLLPKSCLNPGEEIWALDITENFEYRTIPLQIEDPNHSVALEYFKVLISTDELDSDIFCQKPLDPAHPDDSTRGIAMRGQRKQPKEKDWTTITISLSIERF